MKAPAIKLSSSLIRFPSSLHRPPAASKPPFPKTPGHPLRLASALGSQLSVLGPRRVRVEFESAPYGRPSVVHRLRATKGDADLPASMGGGILVGSVVTILFAVANRVLYKLALVPMKSYPFFLAQFTTFGYVVVYFSILFTRYRAGIVTKDMLALPKSRFAAIGFLEALGVASGMSAGAMLPGPAIPILSQGAMHIPELTSVGHETTSTEPPPSCGRLWYHNPDFQEATIVHVSQEANGVAHCLARWSSDYMNSTFLVWQLIFSVLILGRKYSFNQVFGCFLVTAGVALAVASGAGKGQFLSDIEFIWPALMVASSAFQAGASILKEFVFLDGSKRLQGKPPDIFVVNSFGSGFQALFVFLLLPFLSNLRGIPFSELPAYLKSGAACFLNVGNDMTALTTTILGTIRAAPLLRLIHIIFPLKSCEGAPVLPFLFITMNMAFNISLLNLVKMSSALVSSLAATLAVPISIYILSLPLPYIPQGASLSTSFVIGTGTLVLGLLLYNFPQSNTQFSKND